MSAVIIATHTALGECVDGTVVADRDEWLWQLRAGVWVTYGCGFDLRANLDELLPVRVVAVRAYS